MNIFGRKNKQETTSEAKKESTVFTKELWGMVLILFATLTLVCLITREAVFSDIGLYVNAFLLGVFGFTAYVFDVALIYLGIKLVIGKKAKRAKSRAKVFLSLCLAVLLAHTVSVRNLSVDSFGGYLSSTYNMASGGIASSSVGGLLFSLISFAPVKLIGVAGAYAVWGVLLVICLYFTLKVLFTTGKSKKIDSAYVQHEDALEVRDYPVLEAVPNETALSGLYVRQDDFELKTKRETIQAEKKNESFKILYPNSNKTGTGLGYGATVTPAPTDDMSKKLEYIKTPRPVEIPKYEYNTETTRISEPIRSLGNSVPMYSHNETEMPSEEPVARRMQDFDRYTTIEETSEQDVAQVSPFEETFEENVNDDLYSTGYNQVEQTESFEEQPTESIIPEVFGRGRSVFEEPEETTPVFEQPIFEEPVFKQPDSEEPAVPERRRLRGIDSESIISMGKIIPEEQTMAQTTEPEEFVPLIGRVYNRPPIDLFKVYKPDVNAEKNDHEQNSRTIEDTLAAFGINAKVVNFVEGPTVTRYEMMLPVDVSVRKVPPRAEDIAMRLSAESVRIEAPIPGKNLVGIEVPNKSKTTVGLRDIIESDTFQNTKEEELTFALGKDIVGTVVCDNIAKGPHYLVAGSTGMGKSVCLNSMIISMISKYSPEELRLILIDPKQVEFNVYNHLPHLMIDEIINSSNKAIATLQWVVDEMNRRYTVFSENTVNDINEYNKTIASSTVPKMPKIVIVVDEVSDLLTYNKRELEAKILSLAQKARAAGIHVVLATQRPSVDVITGVIKANLPSRIAFRVTNPADSITILSETGAEKLLGNGDMLYRNAHMAGNRRIQGAFISMAEVKSVVSYIKENNEAYFNEKAAADIEKAINPPVPEPSDDDGIEKSSSDDALFRDALLSVIEVGSASISMLRRKFSIGYSKAGWLIDQMDKKGYITPFEGSKSRQVLISREKFEEIYGNADEE